MPNRIADVGCDVGVEFSLKNLSVVSWPDITQSSEIMISLV